MKTELSDNSDSKPLEALPPLSLAEAAWMAGITPDAFERFLDAISLGHLRQIPITELVRTSFTLLGQREAQVAMFRLQLASALQREQELTQALHSKLTEGSTEFFMPHTKPHTEQSAPTTPVGKKNKLKKSKKKR